MAAEGGVIPIIAMRDATDGRTLSDRVQAGQGCKKMDIKFISQPGQMESTNFLGLPVTPTS